MDFFFYKEILCKFFLENLNRIFFHTFWAKSENSKIAKIYYLRTLSEPILSKIRDNFFSKKKASVVVGFWKKNQKISQFSNLNRIFFHIFWAKSENSKIAKIYLSWTISVQSFSEKIRDFWITHSVTQSLTHYHSLRSLFVQEGGVVVRGTARARLAFFFFSFLFFSLFFFYFFLSFDLGPFYSEFPYNFCIRKSLVNFKGKSIIKT